MIPLAQRAQIYPKILELKEATVARLDGLSRQSAQQDLDSWQERWIRYLVKTKQYSAAASALAALPEVTRDRRQTTLVPLELQIDARLGTLDATLASYRSEPQKTPDSELLRTAGRQLFEAGDMQSARNIVELVFAREIEEHKLVAGNFLGLAEIRLASGDTAGALALLHRLALAIGDPFENLDPAAELLEKTGHHAEAIEFLDQLVKSAPWNESYRLRLAKATLAANPDAIAAADSVSAIASSPGTFYDLRLQAARALGGRGHSDLGSQELNLLSGTGTVSASSADKFYFYEARIKAADETADSQEKIQLLSHSIIDFPRRDRARVPLFEAAQSVRSYSYAVAVVEPLFESQFRVNEVPGNANEDEQIASSGDEEETGSDLSPSEAEGQLSREPEISEKIADVMTKLDRTAEALTYYRRARRLERHPGPRKRLNRKIADVQAQLRIEQENAARQPLLHEALQQDRVVRPKLASRAGPANRASAAGDRRP